MAVTFALPGERGVRRPLATDTMLLLSEYQSIFEIFFASPKVLTVRFSLVPIISSILSPSPIALPSLSDSVMPETVTRQRSSLKLGCPSTPSSVAIIYVSPGLTAVILP